MSEYFERKDLQEFMKGSLGELNKEMWDNFMAYYASIFQEGKLSVREKSLIALAVAHAIHCPYCIEAYTTACLDQGYTKEEMMEAVHVASSIAGGAVLAYSTQMKKLADDMEM